MKEWYVPPVKKSLLAEMKQVRQVRTSGEEYNTYPSPFLLAGISKLWRFLEMVNQDWQMASQAYQGELDQNPGDVVLIGRTKHELNDVFLKCMFSFVLLAVSLENAYSELNAEVDSLQQLCCPHLASPNKPPRTDYFDKVRSLRNLTIAHMNSTHMVHRIDKANAHFWDVDWPYAPGKPDVGKFAFKLTPLRFQDDSAQLEVEPRDFSIESFDELYSETINYLKTVDQYYCDRLTDVMNCLPVDTEEFTFRVG